MNRHQQLKARDYEFEPDAVDYTSLLVWTDRGGVADAEVLTALATGIMMSLQARPWLQPRSLYIA